MLAYPAHAALASSGDTVQGLYDALLGTMKSGPPPPRRSWRSIRRLLGRFVAFGFLGLFIGPTLIAIAFTLFEAWRSAPTAVLVD